MEKSEIQLILDEIKQKAKNENSFKVYVNSNKHKNNIIDYIKSKYLNITEAPDKLLLNLYYASIPFDYSIPKCPICNKNRKHYTKLDFHKTCGDKNCIKQLSEQIILEKYGVKNVFQNKEIQNKIKQIFIEKYGVENISQTKEWKQKVINTNKTKFGVEWYKQTNECNERYNQTNLEKYGVKNVFQNKEIQNKIKQTNLEKYGTENVFASKEIQNKIKQTNLEKYGVEYQTQSDNFKEKSKIDWLKKFGVDNPMKSEEVKNKAKQTNLERYGSEYYAQTEEFKKRVCDMYNNKRINKFIKYILYNNLNITHIENNCFLCNDCNEKFNISENFLNLRLWYEMLNICPNCYPKNYKNSSDGEHKLIEFLKELNINNTISNYKEWSNGKYEIDIYIPYLKIGFEYNGLYWHNELNKNKYYHRDKSKLAAEKGIRLIHVWEDDWIYKNEIVKSRIRNLLGKTENKIYGRNTKIKEINFNDCKQFLDENHIQGCGVGNIRYGLFFGDELVSVIQVDKSGLLSRFANKLNTNVIGGFSKLFKHCEKYIKYTFIDLDWSSENNIYSKYMKFDSYVEPTWYLLYKGKRVHRRNFQKKKLLQMGLGSPEQTEHEITLSNKLYRIYNSGNIKYVRY